MPKMWKKTGEKAKRLLFHILHGAINEATTARRTHRFSVLWSLNFLVVSLGTTEYYRNRKGNVMDRAYYAFKKEDEQPKPKPVKLKPSEPIPRPVLKQLLKVP